MKKLRFILMLLVTLGVFCACGGEFKPEESSETPETPPNIYTIVYSRLYEEAAKTVAEAVMEKAGLEFECVAFEKGMELPQYAVIIGDISDGVSETLCKDIARLDFGTRVAGDRVYCYGGCGESVVSAAKYLANALVNERGIEPDEDYNYFYDNPYSLENATINGIDIGEFTLVYASTENEAKYGDVAEDFKTYLRDNANVRVRAMPSGKPDGEKEILIGIVPNRGIVEGRSEAEFGDFDYEITVSGDKVAIIGGNACAVWQGCMAFAKDIERHDDKAVGDMTLSGSARLVKVSCVGDSITEGGNSSDPHSMTYPVYLQRMLGYDYIVKNHGHSGYSVVFSDEYSYSKSPLYTKAKEFAPDVVIYMLGTNDCNPGQDYKSWDNGNREAAYRADTMRYLNSFRDINGDVQIFMSIPPTLCYSTIWPWEEWAARIEKHVSIINREIAEEEGLPIVDMYSWSKNHPEVFKDGLHPYNESYKVYAERVYDEIKDVIITRESFMK